MSLSSMLGVSVRHTEADVGHLKLSPSELEHQFIMQLPRYLDASSPEPVVKDPWIIEVHDKIEWNFDEGTRMDQAWIDWLAHRVRLHDEWCQRFIDEHAEKETPITILRLCPGLDSKNHRVKYSNSVRWIDVDLPQVVDLRRQLVPPPTGADYHQIKAEILTKEWLNDVPHDRPTLIIAEHLFSWLPAKPAQDLIYRLTYHFPRGQLHMCVTGSLVGRMMSLIPVAKGSGLKINWGIDSPRQITALSPRLRTLDALTDKDLYGQGFLGDKKPPWLGGLTTLTSIIPGGKTMLGYMRFAFDDYSESIMTTKTTSTGSVRSAFSRSFRSAKGSSSSSQSIASSSTRS